MNARLTWLGHACWQLNIGDVELLLDPFLTNNPVATVKASDRAPRYILISHGHSDHVGDAAAIANRCGATVISNYEITSWLSANHGVKHTIGMNIGGGVNLPFGRVQLTQAWHSSALPDGSNGGNPAGFLISLSTGKRLYFACDTGLFGDMQLIGARGLDVAVVPIGDLFTMGVEDSVEAIKLLQPKVAIPAHFNTWPPIAQDAQRWSDLIVRETTSRPVVLPVNGSVEI